MPLTHAELVINAEKNIIESYIDSLKKKKKEIACFLQELFAKIIIENNRTKRYEFYEELIKTYLSGEDQKNLEYLEEYTKLLYVVRSVRKVMNAKISLAEKEDRIKEEKTPATADFFEYVLAKMDEQRISPEKAKEFFNKNALAMFSLTAHPTNPISVAFVELLNEFEKIYANNKDITDIFRKIHVASTRQSKKIPAEEMQETVVSLNSIYRSIWPLKQNLEKAVAKYSEYTEAIDIEKVLVKPSVWACGDGDGNPNADVAALQQGVKILQKAIIANYNNDLEILGLREISKKLSTGAYKTAEELFTAVKESAPDTCELEYKIKTFGFSFAGIDIRHNAEDLKLTFDELLSSIDDEEIKIFAQATPKEQRAQLEKWLSEPDGKIITKLRAINPEILENNVAKRILGRLYVAAEHPDVCTKLIIAENKTAMDVLRAMLLLMVSGHKIAEKGAKIDIVTLSESVKDLRGLSDLIADLLKSPTYCKHLTELNCFTAMIAKSDTTRRNGRGAEYEQLAAVAALQLVLILSALGILIRIFIGGGAALQRGGGRMTETAHVVALAARMLSGIDDGINNMGPSTLTIQGHQCELLFSPCAASSLEAFASQNWYAAMQAAGILTARESTKEEKSEAAICKFYDMSQSWLKEYRKLIGNPDDRKAEPGNPAFDLLYKNGPWVPVILGNLSSRPAKRGAKNPGEYPTAGDIKGENPRLLDNRAITVERMTAHAGLFTITYLGMLPGLLTQLDNLHETYKHSKFFRDSMRITAIALFLTDFEHAWQMMLGEKRPSLKELIEMANVFESKKYTDMTREENLAQKTLAWLEITALKTAICLRNAILDKDILLTNPAAAWNELNDYLLKDTSFNLKTVLQEAWPELAQQLAFRERLSELARLLEAAFVNNLNTNPKLILNELRISLIQCVYQACDLTNAPEASLAMELTRIIDTEKKLPFSREASQESLLKLLSDSSRPLSPADFTSTVAPIVFEEEKGIDFLCEEEKLKQDLYDTWGIKSEPQSFSRGL